MALVLVLLQLVVLELELVLVRLTLQQLRTWCVLCSCSSKFDVLGRLDHKIALN